MAAMIDGSNNYWSWIFSVGLKMCLGFQARGIAAIGSSYLAVGNIKLWFDRGTAIYKFNHYPSPQF